LVKIILFNFAITKHLAYSESITRCKGTITLKVGVRAPLLLKAARNVKTQNVTYQITLLGSVHIFCAKLGVPNKHGQDW